MKGMCMGVIPFWLIIKPRIRGDERQGGGGGDLTEKKEKIKIKVKFNIKKKFLVRFYGFIR